jgi:cell shape-determining protein MreD
MKLRVQMIFFALYILIDIILGILFPTDYALRALIFVPQMTLAGVILSVRDMKLTEGLLLALIVGTILDITHFDFGFINAISFTTTVLLVAIWSQHMSESFYELIILTLVGLFIKEIIVFLLYQMSGDTHMSVITWLAKREFLTILGNIPIIIGCIYLNSMKEDMLGRQDRIRRAREKVLWMNVNR